MAYYGRPLLTAASLSPVWSHIKDEDKTSLKLTLGGNYTLSAQQQFENYYINRYLVARTREDGEQKFIMLFYDNILLVDQIKSLTLALYTLKNGESWKTKYEHDNESKGVNKNTSDTTKKDTMSGDTTNAKIVEAKITDVSEDETKSRSGATDNNSFINEENLKLLNVDEEKNIMANSLSQQTSKYKLTKDGTTNNKSAVSNKSAGSIAGISSAIGVSVNLNESKGKSASFNKAEAQIQYLNFELRGLRDQFWSKFAPLFRL